MLDHIKEYIDIFICPACGGDLEIKDKEIICKKCQNQYRVENEVPLLFCPNEWNETKEDVTEKMKLFYEESPFPNYETLETVSDLIQKAQKGLFAKVLNDQIPFNTRILEVGCGTGQLSNFLGVAYRTVFGTDICLNSLKLGEGFKRKNNLERVGFYQMNLFRPIFREESFHLIICNGVLHHTSDPFTGFLSISRLVKKGGYILIGLYNKYGRLVTDFRRVIFRFAGDRYQFLDPRLRGQDRGGVKRRSWFMDQYKNPHESKHTIGEVLKWFDRAGFDFMYGIPNPRAFKGFEINDAIFKMHPKGNSVDHFITQFGQVFTGSKEGGLFMMIGRKR